MSKLKFKHVFMLSNIINLIDFKIDKQKINELTKSYSTQSDSEAISDENVNGNTLTLIKTNASATDLQEKVGMELALELFKCLPKAENEIYEFVADIEHTTAEEVKMYSIKELADFFISLINDSDFSFLFKTALDTQATSNE